MTALAAAVVIADLCAALPPAESPDAVDSAAYAAAGDDARAAHDLRVAAIAYRRAVALDPTNAHAVDALAELCRDDAAATDTALLAAIALYERGDLAAAERAFAALTERAAAHLFLGLIALRRHDRARALAELAVARRDPAYADTARSLERLAHRDGRIAVFALAGGEVDSNPQLLPDTPPAGATEAATTDQDALAIATIVARPARWLTVRDTITYRAQREQSSLDFFGESLQLAADADGRADHAAVRVDLDHDVLAGAAYLFAVRGGLDYRHDHGRASVLAGYALRRREFLADAQAPFTGWVHTGELAAQLRGGERLDLELRALFGREQCADPAFSDLSAGGRLAAHARVGARTRVVAGAALWYARYDGAEPDGSLRRDVHGEGALDIELDLGDHVVALAGAYIAHNTSTIEDFRYDKLVVRAGLALAFGAL